MLTTKIRKDYGCFVKSNLLILHTQTNFMKDETFRRKASLTLVGPLHFAERLLCYSRKRNLSMTLSTVTQPLHADYPEQILVSVELPYLPSVYPVE